MKALVYLGPEQLAYQDAPDPVPGAGEVLIAVESVGICGSDMHAYLGHDERRPAPLILGHEAAGTIVSGPRTGAPVAVNPLVTCGACEACLAGRDNLCPTRQIISMPPREGAFAGLIKMPEANLVALPEGFALEKAALAEPIACGWHAVRLGLGALQAPAGRPVRALVFGGGAIGLGAALCLRQRGITNLTVAEPNQIRRAQIALAEDLRMVAPEALEGAGGYDIVIDGVGYEATRAAASANVRPGGVILHIGLGSATGGLDIRRMTLQEVTFIGTYTYTAEDFRETAAAMIAGSLGGLDWTDQRALSEGAQAFAELRRGTVAAPKVILKPS